MIEFVLIYRLFDLKINLYEYLKKNNLISTDRNEPLKNEEFNKSLMTQMGVLDKNIGDADKSFDGYKLRSNALVGAVAGAGAACSAVAAREFIEWISERNHAGSSLVAWSSLKEAFGEGNKANKVIETTDFKSFVKASGYDNAQRVSYGGFAHQGTPPEAGVRALPELLENLKHNKKLNANFTELMMQYKQDKDNNVIVDASKMFGKELKGLPKSGGQMG
jgi:hypothetical protein